MEIKRKIIPFIVKDKRDIAKTLTEKDFEDAPITEEPDGDYQMLEIYGTTYFRNMDTGDISY